MDSTTPLLDEATRRFVAEHACDDVRHLALHAPHNAAVDLPLALDQIAGRQTAQRKLPLWSSHPGIVYPPHLAMEQCSSQATADYKAALLPHGDTLVDLTGGMGVDCAAMSHKFRHVTYVERQAALCRVACHNFGELGLHHIAVVNADGEEYLRTLDHADVIYLDPARRDHAGRRTYAIGDCSPDVALLAPTLLARAPLVMVKLSPMLDLSQTLATLPSVSEVHLVSVGGECKELLVLMRHGHTSPPVVHCVSDGDDFAWQWGSTSAPAPLWSGEWWPTMCVYEPNPSLMKAQCFDAVAARYGLAVVSAQSHLLVGEPGIAFPGRAFVVDAVTTMNKRELRCALAGIEAASVAVRNFPLSADALRRRLRLRDGGDTHIVGTTTAGGAHVLLITHRLAPTTANPA